MLTVVRQLLVFLEILCIDDAIKVLNDYPDLLHLQRKVFRNLLPL